MPPRSRSTAAVRATSRPIPRATHHSTTRVRACLRTCVRRCAARSRRRPAASDRVRHQVRLVRAGPSRELARRARREGSEEHQHHHTTRVRTCVRSTQPQEARLLERPSSPSRNRPASSEQAHRASSVGSHLEGRREGRSAVTSLHLQRIPDYKQKAGYFGYRVVRPHSGEWRPSPWRACWRHVAGEC